MYLKKIFIYSMCFLFPMVFFGQIKVSEYIQSSTIAHKNDKALYFVDFWATWCGPCIHASKYIESLQKQFPEKLYVLSLSQESPEVVKRFMVKNTNGLAVAIDYEGQTFTKNNVSSLPYSILYNAQGTKLWEGHPADFKPYHVEKFLQENRSLNSIDKMIKVQAYQKAVVKEEVEPNKDFEIIKLGEIEEDNPLQVTKHKTYLELKGSLKDILAYSFDSYENQIEIPSSINDVYQMRFKLDSDEYNNKVKFILKALKLKLLDKEIKGEVLVFDINEPTFWDTNQINWGDDTPCFLIGDSEIKADNVTLKQIKYQLSNLLETPIVINSKDDDNNIHDWDIHYKYFDLMVSNMHDNYGIIVEKKVVDYPQYIITKRRG